MKTKDDFVSTDDYMAYMSGEGQAEMCVTLLKNWPKVKQHGIKGLLVSTSVIDDYICYTPYKRDVDLKIIRYCKQNNIPVFASFEGWEDKLSLCPDSELTDLLNKANVRFTTVSRPEPDIDTSDVRFTFVNGKEKTSIDLFDDCNEDESAYQQELANAKKTVDETPGSWLESSGKIFYRYGQAVYNVTNGSPVKLTQTELFDLFKKGE